MIEKPRIAILSGEPTSTLSFGEIWHFFEQQLRYPISVLDMEYFESIDLTEYEVLILPDGKNYKRAMGDELLEKIADWVDGGGKLIAIGGALKAFADKEGFGIKTREIKKDSLPEPRQVHGLSSRERLMENVNGAIFKTAVDITHPLAFGYNSNYFTLKLKNGSYEPLLKGTVATIADPVPLAGFAGIHTRDLLTNSLVFGVETRSKGKLIYLVDNPLFRGFWENGKLFFVNALFMVP